MLKYIQELLFSHNCVIIPNFGALLANYEPAELRLHDNVIFPPSKLIAFNSSLKKNDGLLIDAVKQNKNITYQEAEVLVNDFAHNCQQLLTENKSLIFDGIGKFKLDSEGNIQFQPYHTINYNLNSYGLPKLSISPVQRLKENESRIKENYQRKLHPEITSSILGNKPKHLKKWWLSIAAISLLFLTVISYFGLNLNSTVIQHSQSSLLPQFENVNTQETEAFSKDKNQNIIIEKQENPTVKQQTLIVTTENKSSVISNASSFIVIGAFFDENRANKLKAEVEAKGFQANILKDEANGLFRATVKVELKDTESALQKVKAQINPRAWILCKQCNF